MPISLPPPVRPAVTPSGNARRALDEALDAFGLQSLTDLIRHPAFGQAKLVVAAAGEAVDLTDEIRALVDTDELDVTQWPELPASSLRSIGPAIGAALDATDEVDTIEALANIHVMATIVLGADQPAALLEPASAPPELLPRMIGSTTATARYTRFIDEYPFALADIGVQLAIDETRVGTFDPVVATAFQADIAPVLRLGFAAGFRQRWINLGTGQGEPVKSIGLAPGETRRIAVVDWERRTSTTRAEDTDSTETMSASATHRRALTEVMSTTASELQSGGTSLAAGTLATAGAAVGSVGVAAGAGAAIGAGVGALFGGVGAAPGALIGLGAGALVGGIGAVISGAANGQLGVIETTSSGERGVTANLSQQINDVSSQRAVNTRSLMSTVILTDTQAERENTETHAIANYNHAHALTIHYFEVLQHYWAETELAEHEPLLMLPFRPIEFTAEYVRSYWHVLRRGFAGAQRVRFDALMAALDDDEDALLPEDEAEFSSMTLTRLTLTPDQQLPLWAAPVLRLRSGRQTLDGKKLNNTGLGSFGRAFTDGTVSATADIGAVQVELAAAPGLPGADLSGASFSDILGGGLTFTVEIEFSSDANDFTHTFTVRASSPTVYLKLLQELRQERRRRASRHDRLAELMELRALIAQRGYLFTRLLLLSLEPEQLRDVVEALMFVRAEQRRAPAAAVPGLRTLRDLQDRRALADEDARITAAVAARLQPRPPGESTIPVTSLVDPRAIGIADGLLVLRLRSVTAASAPLDFERIEARLRRALVPVRDYPAALRDRLDNSAERLSGENIYLPTGGVFAEAVLGLSISAERLDGARNIHWHELPIPHQAPEILAVQTGSRVQAPANLAATVPTANLLPQQPVSLPDPALAAGVLTALNNGNLFRDMSGATELAGVLNNLSTLAGSMANQAGTLAGAAQQKSVEQAGQLAAKVADLSAQLLQAQLNANPQAPTSGTGQGILANKLADLAQAPAVSPAGVDFTDDIARAFGGTDPASPVTNGARPATGSGPAALPDGTRETGSPDRGAAPGAGLVGEVPEQFRAPSDSAVRDRTRLDAVGAGGDVDAVRRAVDAVVTNSLMPLAQKAGDSDTDFDRAAREVINFEAGLQAQNVRLSQVDTAGAIGRKLNQVRAFMRDGFASSIDRSIESFNDKGAKADVDRIEALLALDQAAGTELFGDIQVDSLDDVVSRLGWDMEIVIDNIVPFPTPGDTNIDVTLTVTTTLPGDAAAPQALVTITTPFDTSADGETVNGSFTGTVFHPGPRDPSTAGFDGAPLTIAVTSLFSQLLFRNVSVPVPGLLALTRVDPPTSAAPVHVAADLLGFVRLRVTKGSIPVQGARVDAAAGQGRVDIANPITNRSGEVELIYTPPLPENAQTISDAIIATVRFDGQTADQRTIVVVE